MRKISRTGKENMKGLLRGAETLLEVLIMTILYFVIWRMTDPEAEIFGYFYRGKYVLMGTYAILMLIVFQGSDCTMFGQFRISELLIGQIISLTAVNLITYLQLCLMAEQLLPFSFILLLLAAESVVSVVCVALFQKIYFDLYQPHDILLVYGSRTGVLLKFKMDVRSEKYHITELVSADAGFEEICSRLETHDAVVLNEVPVPLRNQLLKFCYRNGIWISTAPELTDIMLRGALNNKLFDVPLFMVRGCGLLPGQRIAKRFLDVLVSSAGILFLSPIMILAAAAIFLENRGPILRRELCVTRGGQEFMLLRFRTTVNGDPSCNSDADLKNCSGRTKTGYILQKLRLDGLPKLFNVLKGDMSIVGPAPDLKAQAERFSKAIPEYDFRLKVRAGLTGYAQVFGNPRTTAYDRLRMDLMYIETYSLVMDLKLVVLSLYALFRRGNAVSADTEKENEKLAEQLIRDYGQNRE